MISEIFHFLNKFQTKKHQQNSQNTESFENPTRNSWYPFSVLVRIIFLHENKSLLMERSRRSLKILYSIPYPNLELNVARLVVKGYRGSK